MVYFYKQHLLMKLLKIIIINNNMKKKINIYSDIEDNSIDRFDNSRHNSYEIYSKEKLKPMILVQMMKKII